MAMGRTTRTLCILSVCFGIAFGIAAAALIGSGEPCVSGVVGLIAGVFLLPLVPLIRQRLSAPKPQYQRDILLEDLGFDVIMEVDGVQFAVLVLPDEMAAPSHGVLAVVLQNAHATPRAFSLLPGSHPFDMDADPVDVALQGGQVKIVTRPLFAPSSLAEGEHLLKYGVRVSIPGPVGARVIPRRGGLVRRPVVITWVRSAGGAADAAPRLRGLKLNEVLYETGWAAPKLEVVKDLLTES